MSRLDALKDPLARAIDRAVRTFEEQLDGQLEDGRRRLRAAAEALKDELPTAVLADEAVAHLAAAPEGAATDTLLDAVARIDAAGSQGDVLSALLDGARSLADRSAFFVAHENGLAGWAGSGFGADDEVIGGRQIAFDGPWERLARVTGAVRLEGDDAAGISAAFGTLPAAEGVFVPLFLRNRLGGFLYADRTDGGGSLDTAALRLLTHAAALCLETLSVRAGASATLAVDDGAATAPLPVFVGADAADAAPPVSEATDQEAAAPDDDQPVESAPQEAIEDGSAGVPESGGDEIGGGEVDSGAELPALSLDETAGLEQAAVEAATASHEDATTSVKPAQDPATEELFGDDTITEHIQVDASFPRISREDGRAQTDDASDSTDTLELEPIDPSLIEPPAGVDGVPAGGSAFELDDRRFSQPSPQQTVRVEVEPPAPPAAVEPPTAALEEAASEDATIMAQRSAVYQPPAAKPEAAPKPRKTSEVQPPTDLSGPGSAFSADTSAGEEALREEARRLARLLVSEIKLYNEDPLEEGRREGNIYNRMREDIDRSRKMYHERIDPRLEEADDFFYQELVDRLAGGNADLLGM